LLAVANTLYLIVPDLGEARASHLLNPALIGLTGAVGYDTGYVVYSALVYLSHWTKCALCQLLHCNRVRRVVCKITDVFKRKKPVSVSNFSLLRYRLVSCISCHVVSINDAYVCKSLKLDVGPTL